MENGEEALGIPGSEKPEFELTGDDGVIAMLKVNDTEIDLTGKPAVSALAYYSKEEGHEAYDARLGAIHDLVMDMNQRKMIIPNKTDGPYHKEGEFNDLQNLVKEYPELGEELSGILGEQRLQYAFILGVVCKDETVQSRFEEILADSGVILHTEDVPEGTKITLPIYKAREYGLLDNGEE